MNEFDRKIKKLAQEEKIEIPEDVKKRVEDTLSSLPQKNESKIRPFKIVNKVLASAACLAFVFLILMPNISVGYAEKLEDVPVLGSLIKVVTVRNYIYDDGRFEADIEVPELDPSEGEAAQHINMSIQELTDKVLEEFNGELEQYSGDGHAATYVDYEVLRNTEDWFTLKLNILTVAASSDTNYTYYHIDRRTGKITYLDDLFKSDKYADRIEKIIKKQMRDEMKKDENIIYWTEKEDFGGEFMEITPHHGFYFDDNDNLVITFNRYEVGPGYMGCPEFTIKIDQIKDLLKDEYKK